MSIRASKVAQWLLALIIGLGLIGAVFSIGRSFTERSRDSSPQSLSSAADAGSHQEVTAKPGSAGPQVYRIYGQFLMDDEADLGREGLSNSVLQLKVERYELAVQQEKPDPRYPALAWTVIEEGYQGVYGLSDPLKMRLNKQAQLTGVVYDKCGYGLYLRREDDSEADCFLPDKPTHVELVDSKRRPLTVLPAR